MTGSLDQLKARLEDVLNLDRSLALMGWDHQVCMPEEGSATRAAMSSTLSRMSHELFTASDTGKLLESAKAELNGAGYEGNDASLVRVTTRDYEKATKIPAELVAEISHHSAMAHNVWAKARAENDFKSFAPYLEKTIELSRRVAEHLGYQDRIYDALIDQFEPGMLTSEVEAMYADLKINTVPMIQKIAERQDRASDEVLRRFYAEPKQEEFTEYIAAELGYDFKRGRQDRAVHPFCQGMSRDDVRITTRFDEHFLQPAVFGTMHEAGHAMYEQGTRANMHGRMATGTSLGVHESQSRLWENIVGRSKGFWKHYYPILQQKFPEALSDVEMDTFYRAINKSAPSLIRVEADEVTYNMHTLVRFEMENEFVEGKLKVSDAPEAWNAKYKAYLGIVPPNDTLGILQDVHWSGGMMGYFPTYTIGNLLSAQLYEKALADVPSIPADIEQGKFSGLLGWLNTNVHAPGRNFMPQELVKRVTGEPLNSRAYIKYLNAKYGEIYGF